MQVAAREGPLFHRRRQTPRHPAPRRVSLFLFVQRRRDTEARQGVRAAGLHTEAFSRQHSVSSQNNRAKRTNRVWVELPKSAWQRTYSRGPSTPRPSGAVKYTLWQRFSQGDRGRELRKKINVSAVCVCQDVLFRD
jgi:hypothetical protein